MPKPATLADRPMTIVPLEARPDGRGETIRVLVREHLRTLQRFAMHLTMDRAQADDLVRRTIEHATLGTRGPDSDTTAQQWLLATMYSLYMMEADAGLASVA